MNTVYKTLLPRTPFGGKFIDRELETGLSSEFESSEEFETSDGRSGQNSQNKNCHCQSEINNTQSNNGNISPSPTTMNPQFVKSAVLIHLRNHFRVNDFVKLVHSCCIDPDFSMKKCAFTTAGNLKGAILWLPFNKELSIMICFKGQKIICWYNYMHQNGQLQLTNKRCINKSGDCNL